MNNLQNLIELLLNDKYLQELHKRKAHYISLYKPTYSLTNQSLIQTNDEILIKLDELIQERISQLKYNLNIK